MHREDRRSWPVRDLLLACVPVNLLRTSGRRIARRGGWNDKHHGLSVIGPSSESHGSTGQSNDVVI